MTRKSAIAVIGDLHYEPEQHELYCRARRQIIEHSPDAVLQLGDQGGYSHCGTWRSFMEGLDFLDNFDLPFHMLIGNHDLEGCDYATDAQAVAAWCQAFERTQPYYSVDLGAAVGICLSTTRFRSNPGCRHEVYLDEVQVGWLRATLAQHRSRPTFVFSHAPVLGSGLRVLQSLHLKCPNAWINHTDRPERFIGLVRENPQIKLWFSAHNHLGHCYGDSTSRVGDCTFVHTGVIGDASRDGCRQSRLVEFDEGEFVLATIDHTTGQRTDNVRHDYATGRNERLSEPVIEQQCDHFAPPACPAGPERLELGSSVFALHREMLVEFDAALQAPLGVVIDRLADQRPRVRDGRLELVDLQGTVRVLKPNPSGRYYQVFEPNPSLEQRLSA